MNEMHLKVYLDDHLMGASTVIELVRRRLDRDDAPPWLHTFLQELQEEREVLQTLARAIGGQASPVKQAAGWVAEKAAQLKLTADAQSDGTLRDLLELETMRTGVEGKRCLIRSLRCLEDDPRIAQVDLDWWQDLAEAQAERLEALRLQAVMAAIAGDG